MGSAAIRSDNTKSTGLEFREEVLVSIEGLDWHEVRERVVVVVVLGDEGGDGGHLEDTFLVHIGEEGVVEDTAGRAFLDTNASEYNTYIIMLVITHIDYKKYISYNRV